MVHPSLIDGARGAGAWHTDSETVTRDSMQHLVAVVRGLASDEGQDLLEYGLLAVLIAIVAMGAVSFMGAQINAVLWQTIVNNF